ncbi:putative DNA-binding protein [Chitinispirillum alkaliphilum]|nr:putative DNA-binding protein [Chitinispirillum alkaliphilum]
MKTTNVIVVLLWVAAAMLLFKHGFGSEEPSVVYVTDAVGNRFPLDSLLPQGEVGLVVSFDENSVARELQPEIANEAQPGVAQNQQPEAVNVAANDDVAQQPQPEIENEDENGIGQELQPKPGCTNVNTADISKLVGLPGIGPVLAQRIIERRTQHGNFKKADDLLEVSGIGPSRLGRIAELICF